MRISVPYLMKNAIFNDQFRDTIEGMWEKKFEELSDEFIESVEENGVKGAIVYSPDENTVYNGHHRILVAWLLGIEYLEFVENFNDSPEEYLVRQGWPESRKRQMYG